MYRDVGHRSISISDEPFIDLVPGKYVIRAKIYGKTEAGLSIYSEQRVSMEMLVPEVGKHIMKSYYIQRVREVEYKLYREPEYYKAEIADGKYRYIFAFQNRQ